MKAVQQKHMKISFRLAVLLLLTLTACKHPHASIKVGIQPLGDVPHPHIAATQQALQQVYLCEVVVLHPLPMPLEVFINIKTPRYRADKILMYLKKIMPDTVTHILAITPYDISTTKYASEGKIKYPESKYKDWGIFGLGYRPGTSAVISTYRLHSGVSSSKFLQRIQKISVHEVGHNLGLPHCDHTDCVMADAAETIHTIDNVNLSLCGTCKSNI